MRDRHVYKSFVFDSTRWDGFELREDDIIISTPPKCGTTWMQMMVALLLFRTADLPLPLAVLSPWLDMNTRPLDEVFSDLAQQEHRRFIKTHTPLDGLPWDPRVTYVHVARDPRDVALSWDNHLSNVDMGRLFESRIASVGMDDFEDLGITGPPPPAPEDPAERFWLWMENESIDDSPSGFASLANHVRSFWDRRDEPNVHLFHYSDLRADLAGQMGELAEALHVEPPGDDLVEAATFEKMKRRADELAPNTDLSLWQDNNQFFDRARNGDWKALLGDGDDVRYEQALSKHATDELADWLHHGWLGATSTKI